MKKLVFWNGIYSLFKPLYYVCKLFGLASYSYTVDRHNKTVTTDYGYLNYTFTVLWLITYAVALPVYLPMFKDADMGSQTLLIGYIFILVSSYASSFTTLVFVSIIKRRKFLQILENISEVDKKIFYKPQEETYMNRKVMFNIISDIILATVIQCFRLVHNVRALSDDPYYVLIMEEISSNTSVCNTLILCQFVNLVFVVKQRYSHLNKRITNWIHGTVNKPVRLRQNYERCFQSNKTVDQVNSMIFCISSYGNIERTLKPSDIHSLRLTYSQLYDITCLINETYGIPVLASMFWILTSVVYAVYEGVHEFTVWGVLDIVNAVNCSLLLLKITFFCDMATNEASFARILVQKLLLAANWKTECLKELKMFSLQLQVMANEYNAYGFFSINLGLFCSVSSVIVTYVVIMFQMK